MNSDETIEKLYMLIRSKYGTKEAKSTIKAIIGNILDDLETEEMDVSSENISKCLQKYLEDFQEASKSEVA
jgi:hypothetical protein